MGNRRMILGALGSLGGLVSVAALPARAQPAALRFGTTPVFLDDQIGLLARWQRHLQARLARPLRFVQRGSYREIIDLLLNGGIDAAWLCGFPFVLYESSMRLVAVPAYQGQPLYRSYLIVPQSDARSAHVSDLRGRAFAYSDPRSNSGYLVPRVELLRAGQAPERFFKRSFFTFGHRKVVEAVQAGLAEGGAVDGYVWDTLRAQQPHSVAGVRVAWQSAPFGFPPVVARATLDEATRRALAQALVGMADDAEGRTILQALNLDRFDELRADHYDSIRELVRQHARSERETS